MKPSGVHLIEPGVLKACGYLYPTGESVDTYFGMMPIDRCAKCGAEFDSTEYMDHDIIRTLDYIDDIDMSDLDAIT